MKANPTQPDSTDAVHLEEVVGYLNFSSGAYDPRFHQNLNELYRSIEANTAGDHSLEVLQQWLSATLDRLAATGGAFSDISQARSAHRLLFSELLPAYWKFHSNLLYHQQPANLWRPLFVARAWEALLAQGGPWEETDRIVQGALTQLNDFVGYRPVATLESGAHCEPYPHEFVRPIPLYIREAGVGVGRYERIIQLALEILGNVEEGILARAWFDLDRLEEIALDPRAYDFDHPVNRRPNYHFGMWDPHHISSAGYYTRFVVQQITLDALLIRCEDENSGDEETVSQRWFEAATVLAGTMLMASGTSGDGPGRHDSSVTLAVLLPHIAVYRDEFYEQMLLTAQGSHAVHLREEAERYHQPFGAARQHLNQELASRRALQLQRVHLAHLFARMGYSESALQQANSVRVAAARILSEIYCRLTAGHDAIDRNRLGEVVDNLTEIEDLILRAIECGALVDPWNVVGFAGNFSLFPALENTVHDWRVDELIELVEQVLDLCARAWSEAAAIDDFHLEVSFSTILTRLSAWWDQYATSSVEDVKRLVAKEIEVSANLVAGALNAWHKAGAAAGDIGFWQMFVEQFDSSKAFQLVIEALLDQGDTVASMALMMQWVSQKERTPLEEGDSSFHRLAFQWLASVEEHQDRPDDDTWPQVVKFFAYLEANAEEFWQVPTLMFDEALGPYVAEMAEEIDYDLPFDDQLDELDPDELDDDEGVELFGAAYEEMVFRGSTDDGYEGDLAEEGGELLESDWEYEVDRLEQRLSFLTTVARLWKHTAISWGAACDQSAEHREVFDSWLAQAAINYRQLVELLETVHRYRFSQPSGSHESLVEYDRLRTIKEALVQKTITTCVETSGAAQLLMATRCTDAAEAVAAFGAPIDTVSVKLLQGVLSGDAAAVVACWEEFIGSLESRPLLYVPHSRGGQPQQNVATRALHQLLHDLLGWLPQLGLIRETCQLLDLAQQMEIDHPVGQGAVTEFDRLFENGCQAIVRTMAIAAQRWDDEAESSQAGHADHLLVDALQHLTERQLDRWLRHSRTLRLSVVENMADPEDWQQFVEFVERYGADLFDQKFLSLGNLRGILHQGVERWLETLSEDPDAQDEIRLIGDLDTALPRKMAVERMEFALEAVVENYRTYLDYNTTTTQSDRGDQLFVLIDFLRLRAAYDRVAWNLKPVVWVYNILVRQHRIVAAEMWSQAFAARTCDAADTHQAQLEKLCQKHGMRLATIADRVGERFQRPLMIDRIKALVGPAMADEEEDGGRRRDAFEALEGEIASLASEPCGAGLDLPDWLAALEDEVTDARSRLCHQGSADRLTRRIGQVLLKWDDLVEQLADME